MLPSVPLLFLLASLLPFLSDGQTIYSREDSIRIPFEIRSGGPATKVVLYYRFNGEDWKEYQSTRPSEKREFSFQVDRDGTYSFATLTYFEDGTSYPDSKRLLTEQRRVVIDRVPPKILYLRQRLSADGAPGIDWHAVDKNVDPAGIRLEFKWPEMSEFLRIDRHVLFSPRSSRFWQMKDTERMQIRLIATDRAGNRTVSDPLYVSTKDAQKAIEPSLEKKTLFESGTAGYAHYRIPGIVVTDQGTLIAYCEARKTLGGDWGAIDLMYRRSEDGGKTWSEAKKFDVGSGFEKNPVAINQKLGKFPDITVNNPVMIADKGVVHFLYCVEYMRAFYTRSEDDGKTFSPPVEITRTFEDFKPTYDWKVIATGPGHGIRLTKSGRLIVPVWLSTGEGGHAHRPSAVGVIFSDDAGKTWKPGDIVVKHPELTNPSETAAVELPDGKVMLNIRHESSPHRRAMSISGDGVTKWSKPVLYRYLPEPICMGSLVRQGNRVLFSNPHNTDGRDRRNVSIQVSEDSGKSWKYRRSIESGFSGYSDLAVVKDDSIFCFYERGGLNGNATQTESLVLAKFNLEWMTKIPTRIVCLGDSITKGYRPGVKETEAFPYRIETALRKDGIDVEVLNVGIGGETSTQGLKRLKAAVIDQRPHFVTIMYGANDSYIDKGKTIVRVPLDEYRANLTAMVRELKKEKITPILMTTNRYGDKHPPDGSGNHPHLQMDAYMKACREVAESEKVGLIDHQSLWIEAAKRGTDIETWMTDHVHPNARGHEEMAKGMLVVLKKAVSEKRK